jgi:hypothetical protein
LTPSSRSTVKATPRTARDKDHEDYFGTRRTNKTA